MNILVVAAHPDDEVLGCGGTISRLTEEGNSVYCLILGEGISSRYEKRGKTIEQKIARLKLETKKAAKILGITDVFFKDLPDNSFDTVPLLKVIKAVEDIKKKVRPDIVYTHHQGDLNIDHSITFKAVLTACRPLKDETVKEIYSFEAPSSTEWAKPDARNYFMPDVFIDITRTLKKKLDALKAYATEVREFPHPRSAKALEAIAVKWGSLAGYEAAEAFMLIRARK